MYHSKIILKSLLCAGFGFIVASQIGCNTTGSGFSMQHQAFRPTTVPSGYASNAPYQGNFSGYASQQRAQAQNFLQQQYAAGQNAMSRLAPRARNFSPAGFQPQQQPGFSGLKQFNPFGFAKGNTSC